MKTEVRFSLAVSEEILGDSAPVLLQGGLSKAFVSAAHLGFDAVEIHIRNPDTFDADKLADEAYRSHIAVSAIGTGLEHTLNGYDLAADDEDLRQETADRFREYIDLGARLDATVFVGLCRGKAPDAEEVPRYLDRFASELVPLASYAEAAGATLSLEPIARYMTNLLTTTRETLEFLERPGLESVLLLMDTHHMILEDDDMHAAFLSCEGRIGHVHISDSDRKYPGSGEIDFAMVGEVLKQIGYDQAVSLEILPLPDGEAAAGIGLKWMQSVWTR